MVDHGKVNSRDALFHGDVCLHSVKMSVGRKPLRKEENGTSRREYAMSIRNKKAMGTNNTVV